MLMRLMDLVVLLAELSQQGEPTRNELDRELMLRGYSPQEIEQAVFWYSSRGEYSDASVRCGPSPNAIRVLSEFERTSISSECHGFLLRLRNLAIVDAEQFERIIARAIPVGPEKVQLPDVKAIACSVVFDRDIDDVEDDFFELLGDDTPAS